MVAFIYLSAAILAAAVVSFALALKRASGKGVIMIKPLDFFPSILVIIAIILCVYNFIYFSFTVIPFYQECIDTGYFPDEEEMSYSVSMTNGDGTNLIMVGDYKERIEICRMKAYAFAAAAVFFAALYIIGICIISEGEIYYPYKHRIKFLCKSEKDRLVFYSDEDGVCGERLTSVSYSVKRRKKLAKYIAAETKSRIL